MGGAYSTYGERRGVKSVWWGNMRKREQLEEPGVDGRIILRWIFRVVSGGMYWIELGLGRETGGGFL